MFNYWFPNEPFNHNLHLIFTTALGQYHPNIRLGIRPSKGILVRQANTCNEVVAAMTVSLDQPPPPFVLTSDAVFY